ncbi:MAG: hypothetical protein PQJ60_02835, partial [Spirochaetales bacterium]|nr:hypothetical protein [Spirochaetales bacterium]
MEQFIRNYTEEQKGKLEFKWNGKEGYHEWGDENFDFRRSVLDAILSRKISAPDILVKDLFEIEAVFARESHGADERLADLGDLLLNQTGSKFV